MQTTGITYHIIGGGLSGLACAKFAKERNAGIRTKVYEAAAHPGGRCFSYDDADLGLRIDNATHAVIWANREIRKLLGPKKWSDLCWFWDVAKDELSHKQNRFKSLIFKSACNTSASEIDFHIIKTIYRQLFPWTAKQRKLCFSNNDLSQRLINPLSTYADELFTDCKLLKIDSQFGKAAQLNFNKFSVEVGAQDRVILALSSKGYYQLLGGESFDYNSIINIVYRTSQPLMLPKAAGFLGMVNGLADWVFINGDTVAVTISDANGRGDNLEDLARKVWKELDVLRGVNSAFVPPFKVFNHKIATIKQDAGNNAKRPDGPATIYTNMFLAGDWTMKNYPCCMETAVRSARRAVKAASKPIP